MPLMIINQLQFIFRIKIHFSLFPHPLFPARGKTTKKEKPKTAAVQPPNNSAQTSIQFPAGTEIS